MLLRATVILSVVLFLTGVPSDAAERPQYWQLTLHYDSLAVEIVNAAPIAPITKQIRTPGLEGAPLRWGCDLEWLGTSGESLLAVKAELPLGIRSAPDSAGPCLEIMPDRGTVVIRVPGPSAAVPPAAVRLTQSGLILESAARLAPPAAFRGGSLTMTVPSTTRSALLDGPVGFEKIRHTGEDFNRLVIVVLGDGYAQASLDAGLFETHTASLESSFLGRSPWDLLFDATNIYRADIASNEEGADNETFGVLRDTYLQSSFWVNGIERLLALTGDGYGRAVAAADAVTGPGVWDVILVLVNSTKYGGSGGAIAVSSVHSASGEIVLHELGHSLAYLADEYESPYPGYPAGDWEPNVDFNCCGSALKWLIWVEPGTPLPTPEDIAYNGVVGSFEGARYLETGIYRPWLDCLMRSLGHEFCPICRESHIVSFCSTVSLADWTDPYPSSVVDVDETGVTFSVTPIPLTGITFEWLLAGAALEGETGPSLLLTADQMTADSQSLEVVIAYETPFVRRQTIADSYSWSVRKAQPSCCLGRVGDVNQSGEDEPTVGDISTLIDHLFVSQAPLTCYLEADIDQSGGASASTTDITIGDISSLIDYLFISQTPLLNCL